MAREISVRAEILRRFRRGHITLVLSQQISTFEWCCAYRKTFGHNCGRWKLALPTKTRSRHQMALWKCAAFSIAQTSTRGKLHSNICAVRFPDSYRIIKMYSHFSAVHYAWCKDVNRATLPWVDFYECCQAWYGMISLQRCLCLLGIHAFVNFASAGDIINCIKTYLLQSIWPARFGNQKWQRKGPVFKRWLYHIISVIIDHPPM